MYFVYVKYELDGEKQVTTSDYVKDFFPEDECDFDPTVLYSIYWAGDERTAGDYYRFTKEKQPDQKRKRKAVKDLEELHLLEEISSEDELVSKKELNEVQERYREVLGENKRLRKANLELQRALCSKIFEMSEKSPEGLGQSPVSVDVQRARRQVFQSHIPISAASCQQRSDPPMLADTQGAYDEVFHSSKPSTESSQYHGLSPVLTQPAQGDVFQPGSPSTPPSQRHVQTPKPVEAQRARCGGAPEGTSLPIGAEDEDNTYMEILP
ncbi:uncharacterized protein LOC135379142 [Ornithodoros turicata]|uniref:uncharacterized protein LOC135379142 n=1 Tax=Ornithodoros turicata TaxID=34597 RepID=UPI003138B033